MKKIYLLLLFGCFYGITFSQSVGIGTPTPHTSALLDIQSTGKGLLLPRMTQAQVNAISSPAQGLVVFNTSANSFQFYNGTGWSNISHSGIINGIASRIPVFSGPWGLQAGMMTDNGNGVAINTNGSAANASAILDMSSNTKGVLIPRMTSAERNAITLPATGLLVYDNTTNSFWFHNGTTWAELVGGGGGSNSWSVDNNNIYSANGGNVGIGISTPAAKLSVSGNASISEGLGIGLDVPNPSYKLDVNGATRTRSNHFVDGSVIVGSSIFTEGNANVDANVNVGDNLIVGGHASITDYLTVNGGRGIVQSSNSAQRVLAFTSGNLQFTNVGAGYWNDVEFGFSSTLFASNPLITLGQITNALGPIERWTFSIHAVNYATGRFLVRCYAANGSPGQINMTLNFMLIGTVAQ